MRWPRSRWRWRSAIHDQAILKALAEFNGVGRRFQRYGDVALGGGGSFTAGRRLRPPPRRNGGDAGSGARRFSRPADGARLSAAPLYAHARLFEDFVKVLSTADALLLAEVYPAGEAPIVAADGRALARARARRRRKVEPVFVEDIAEMPEAIRRVARDGDVVLTMGAGSIGSVAPRSRLA